MTGSPADEEPAPDDKSLAVQVHALRAAASLIETTGIPGLYLAIDTDGQIEVQVPQHLASPARRTAMVARLAAAVGGTVTSSVGTAGIGGWVNADGKAGSHTVCIYTPILANEPQETAPDGEG